jgi:hypothetical protein
MAAGKKICAQINGITNSDKTAQLKKRFSKY